MHSQFTVESGMQGGLSSRKSQDTGLILFILNNTPAYKKFLFNTLAQTLNYKMQQGSKLQQTSLRISATPQQHTWNGYKSQEWSQPSLEFRSCLDYRSRTGLWGGLWSSRCKPGPTTVVIAFESWLHPVTVFSLPTLASVLLHSLRVVTPSHLWLCQWVLSPLHGPEMAKRLNLWLSVAGLES